MVRWITVDRTHELLTPMITRGLDVAHPRSRGVSGSRTESGAIGPHPSRSVAQGQAPSTSSPVFHVEQRRSTSDERPRGRPRRRTSGRRSSDRRRARRPGLANDTSAPGRTPRASHRARAPHCPKVLGPGSCPSLRAASPACGRSARSLVPSLSARTLSTCSCVETDTIVNIALYSPPGERQAAPPCPHLGRPTFPLPGFPRRNATPTTNSLPHSIPAPRGGGRLATTVDALETGRPRRACPRNTQTGGGEDPAHRSALRAQEVRRPTGRAPCDPA
jgi:hypothetical protein